MVQARFRFFGELNDFLARARRDTTFTAPCARNATAKHMIEALGVPHTEVGAILLNGAAAGFEHLLEEGDALEVHPRRGQAAAGIRFIADAHLGGLARLLRMAGFDTLYDNHYRDEAIVAVAAREGRTVLTRDRELLKRREVEQGCYLHTIRPEAQLRELVARYALGALARPFTLCLHCNLPLRAVAKAEVLDRLPESVRRTHDEFTVCDNCGGVFWQGSHHKRMEAILAGAFPLESSVPLVPLVPSVPSQPTRHP